VHRGAPAKAGADYGFLRARSLFDKSAGRMERFLLTARRPSPARARLQAASPNAFKKRISESVTASVADEAAKGRAGVPLR